MFFFFFIFKVFGSSNQKLHPCLMYNQMWFVYNKSMPWLEFNLSKFYLHIGYKLSFVMQENKHYSG